MHKCCLVEIGTAQQHHIGLALVFFLVRQVSGQGKTSGSFNDLFLGPGQAPERGNYVFFTAVDHAINHFRRQCQRYGAVIDAAGNTVGKGVKMLGLNNPACSN